MLVQIVMPLLVAVVGLLIFVLAGEPPPPRATKIATIGLVLFACGVFWTLAIAAGARLTL